MLLDVMKSPIRFTTSHGRKIQPSYSGRRYFIDVRDVNKQLDDDPRLEVLPALG